MIIRSEVFGVNNQGKFASNSNSAKADYNISRNPQEEAKRVGEIEAAAPSMLTPRDEKVQIRRRLEVTYVVIPRL